MLAFDWLKTYASKPIGIDHHIVSRNFGKIPRNRKGRRLVVAGGAASFAATEKGPILVVAKMHLAQFLASLPTKTVENKLVDITIKEQPQEMTK